MSQRSLIGFALLVAVLSGCGALIDGATFLPMLALVSVFIAGCAESRMLRDDAGVGGDSGGSWESCCENGQVASCYCPAGWACNYGWYCLNEDGSCALDVSRGPDRRCEGPDAGSDGGIDGGPLDGGGSWEPCCENGVVTTCYCPTAWECNFGQFCIEANGDCLVGYASFGGMCEVGDDAGPIGAMDAGPGL